MNIYSFIALYVWGDDALANEIGAWDSGISMKSNEVANTPHRSLDGPASASGNDFPCPDVSSINQSHQKNAQRTQGRRKSNAFEG